LLDLLSRLGVTESQVVAVARRARRLARGLPLFESAWVDALAQTRRLSGYQAAEINAGRGQQLRIGPYIIWQPLEWPLYARSFRARNAVTGDWMHLVVVEKPVGRKLDCLAALETLAVRSSAIQSMAIAPVVAAGADGDRRWVVSSWSQGCSAAEWLIHNGRFPPEVVLEVARQTTASLVVLERSGLVHGDLGTQGLVLRPGGEVALVQPGLRAILRPEEGYAHVELPPEAYDYLAPERVADGAPPDAASDLYACGCTWWHMLTGRPPLAGGTALAKLRAAQVAAVPEVRRFAPDTPPALVAAIAACTAAEPGRRPESMARLAALLGPPTRTGRTALARCLAGYRSNESNWLRAADLMQASPAASLRVAAAAAILVVLAALAIPLGYAWSHLRAARNQALAASAAPSPGTREASLPTVHRPPATFKSVVPATALSPLPDSLEQDGAQDLVLNSVHPTLAELLVLRPGQSVHAARGQRSVVVIHGDSLRVAVENVRFTNLDFVWKPSDRARAAPASMAVMIRLEAGGAEFCGCRFYAATGVGRRPIAICWTHPVARSDAALVLPSGRVRLTDCIFRDVETGIDCHTLGTTAVEIGNTLYLGHGALMRVDHCPTPDESLVLAITRLTLRESGPLWECSYGNIPTQPGSISIRASQCALLPAADSPLLRFLGRQSPERLLENTRWTGQDSLVGPKTPTAAWYPPAAAAQILDDSAVAIEGLVRSEVGFAGNAQSEAAASRIIRWQVPLHSPDPPGLNPDTLPDDTPATGHP
jgi:serine/threonine protein kinase